MMNLESGRDIPALKEEISAEDGSERKRTSICGIDFSEGQWRGGNYVGAVGAGVHRGAGSLGEGEGQPPLVCGALEVGGFDVDPRGVKKLRTGAIPG